MQIMRRFEKSNQFVKFSSEFKINNLQNYLIDVIFYQSNQFVMQQKNQLNFYKNDQFFDFKFNQQFSFQDMYDCFLSNKYIYCYRKNHVFQRHCLNFQNDFFSSWNHIFDKRTYFKFFRNETFHVQILIDCNQHDCVIINKKLNEILFLSRSVFAQLFIIFQNVFLFLSQFESKSVAFAKNNVYTIKIKKEIVKKLFTNEKYKFKNVIMNYINMNIIVLFAVVAQNTDKNIKQLKR